jgi:hypothetical protein
VTEPARTPEVPAAPAAHESEELRLRELWQSFSDPRQAACLSWLAFLLTWVVTRLITHHGRGTGTSAAIVIAGHHIHHYLIGLILLALVSAAALFVKPSRGWEFFGIGYGIALALILDEYALLLNLSDVYWQQQGRLSVDIVLSVIALGGVYITAMTLIHESIRRANRYVRRSTS